MPPKVTKCSVNKETLDLLTKSIAALENVEFTDEDNEGASETDNTDLNQVLTCLMKAITTLTKKYSVVNELENELREQGDELDETRQRSLKGNLILSSPSIPSKSVVSLIKSDKQLEEDKELLSDHILGLVKEKYAVDVPHGDVQALHRLPNGNIILRLWNRKPDSAWSKLVSGIRSGKNKGYNLFANFHLTESINFSNSWDFI